MSQKSILAGVLDEVKAEAAADAEVEAARLVAARVAREAEEARHRAQVQARIELEARLRIEAEARRQALVEAQRQAQQRAQQVLADPVFEPEPLPSAEVMLEAPAAMRVSPPRSTAFWFAVVSLPALCATALALAWILGGDAGPTFQAPPPAALPEVASAPEVPTELPEVMPVAHVIEPAVVPVAAPASAAPIKRRPPRVRPVAPASAGLNFNNILETDDTRPR